MDGKRFDQLTEALATGSSRRRVLKLLGGGLATGLAASLGLRQTIQAKGNSDCAHVCTSLFPPGKARGECISQGAHGKGPCAVSADPCAGIDCSSLDGACSTGSCNGGACYSSAINEAGTCITAAGKKGTCADGTCTDQVDLCAGIDCAFLHDACNSSRCDTGVCYPEPANNSFPCTTTLNEEGNCSAGTCLPNVPNPCLNNDGGYCQGANGEDGSCSGGACIPYDYCIDGDCSYLNQDCREGRCFDGLCFSLSAHNGASCLTGAGESGTCMDGMCG